MAPTRPDQLPEKLEIPRQPAIERALQLDGSRVQPGHKPVIGPVEPSSLLSRLQNFIPQMASANKDLDASPEGAIMELHEQSQGPAVELDLACGVFDLNNPAAEQAAERSLTRPTGSNQGDEHNDDDEEDLEEEEALDRVSASSEERGSRKQTKPGIEELS